MTKPSATSTPPARPPPTPPLTTQQPRKATNSTRTKTIVATVVGTLSILSHPTNGQLRRLRTREPNLLLAPPRIHGFGRAFAANGRDAPRAKDPLRQWHSRRRRDRVSSRRREDRALSREDRRNDGAADADDEREKTQTQTQRRNLQPLFADEDDGVSVTTSSQPQQSYDYDYVDGFHDYQYEYDFDYVIPEGTLPDDAVGIFDDPDHDFPDVPPGFPSTEEGEGEEEGVAIVSSPTFDFGFSIPEDNDGYFPPLDGDGDGNNDTPWEEGYPAEIAESSLLEEGGAFSMMVAVPTSSPTTFWAEDNFETTAIDFEEDEDFLGRMSLSMSFGMPNQDQNHDEDGEEVFEDYHHYYYSMSMSMPLTFEPSITPPATEPPSRPPTQSPVHPPSYPPSVSPTTEAPTPYVPTRPSDGDATNTGNGGLIPAEGSSTDAPTPTVGGTATGAGDESTPTFFPTTALPTESFGRAVPATGPSPPSSSSSLALSLSFGKHSFGVQVVCVWIGMMLVV